MSALMEINIFSAVRDYGTIKTDPEVLLQIDFLIQVIRRGIVQLMIPGHDPVDV
ncbi:hypothetical protein D3C73_791340 [compost metagenome]